MGFTKSLGTLGKPNSKLSHMIPKDEQASQRTKDLHVSAAIKMFLGYSDFFFPLADVFLWDWDNQTGEL